MSLRVSQSGNECGEADLISKLCSMGVGGSILRPSPKTSNVLRGHEGSVNAMCVSGSLLATASEDGTCRVWDAETRTLQAEMVGHAQYVNCIAMTEQWVVTGSADRTVRKWDLHTGRCVMEFNGHKSVINQLLVHENLLFSSSFDKTARQWSLLTGECLQVYKGHTRGVSPMLFVDLSLSDTRRERRKSRTRLIQQKNSTCSQFSVKMLLITGAADNTARAWGIDSSASVVQYKGHGSGVLCLAANEGSRELFTGSSDSTARSWDIETGQPLRVFDGHQGAIVCIQVCLCTMFCMHALESVFRFAKKRYLIHGIWNRLICN